MTYLKRRVASHKILQFLQKNKVIFFFQKKSVQSDHWRLLKKKIAKIEGVASLNLKNKRDKKEIQPLLLALQREYNLSYLTCQGSLFDTFCSAKCTHGGKPLSAKQRDIPLSTEDGGNVTTLLNSPKGMASPTLLERPQSFSKSTQITSSQLRMGSSSPMEGVKSSFPRNDEISHVFQEDFSLIHFAEQNVRMEDRLKMVERICGLLYAPNLILGSDSLKKLAHLSNQLREDSSLIFTGGWDGNQLINHLDSLKLLETPQDIWKDGVSCLSSCYARPYLSLHSLLEKRKRSLVYSLKEKMHALVRSLQERKAQQAKEHEKDQDHHS